MEPIVDLIDKKSPEYKEGFEHGVQFAIDDNKKDHQSYYDNGYKQALDDLMEVYRCENLEVFMNDTFKCVMDYNYMLEKHEPIHVIKKFKKWQQEKNFKVGDEVKFNGGKMVITYVDNTRIDTIDSNGRVDTWKATAGLTRTGRHFDEVTDLLYEIG